MITSSAIGCGWSRTPTGRPASQIQLAEWLKRPTREKVFDNLMRLTSALQ